MSAGRRCWNALDSSTRPGRAPTTCRAVNSSASRSRGRWWPTLEVTSALDPELVGEVLDLLGELKADGVTMLLNTHEMGFAREVADLVCFLHDGVIHESGTPDQVLANPTQQRTRAFLSRIRA